MDWLPADVLRATEQLDLSLHVASVPTIDTLVARTVLFRGKRFRPLLCFLMGSFFGRTLEELAPYARAAEFVHAATLAHDDVIDESLKRRHNPTLNARVGNVRAVLIGDVLLSRVMVELSQLGNLHLIARLSETVEDLVVGEWLQLEARGQVSISRLHLEHVAQKKTASLMRWVSRVGAHLAGASHQHEQWCADVGGVFGVAFQMIDDILDMTQDGEKPFCQDLREGLVNVVVFEMLETSPELKKPIAALLGQCTDVWPWTDAQLEHAKNQVRQQVAWKLAALDERLDALADFAVRSDAVQSLRGIAQYLRERIT